MKITKTQLRNLIKEELASKLSEADVLDFPGDRVSPGTSGEGEGEVVPLKKDEPAGLTLTDKEMAIGVYGMVLGFLIGTKTRSDVPMEEIQGGNPELFQALISAVAADQIAFAQDWMNMPEGEFRAKHLPGF
jgi:hypothetical protein